MRSVLLSGIFSQIMGSPDNAFVQAIGGTDDDGNELRYWPWGAQQGAAYPYAVSYIVSDVDVGAISDDISDFEWQMMIYTETMTEGNALAEQCKELFSRQSLSFQSVCFTCMYGMTISPMRETDADPYQTTVTFSCYL